MKRKNKLPLQPIRNIMKENCPYHIREDAIIELENILVDIIIRISIEAVKKFDNLNKLREKQGLRRLKRLNEWAVFLTIKNIIKSRKNIDMGLQPEEIVNPGGKNMSANKNTAEPDKTTNDQREMV